MIYEEEEEFGKARKSLKLAAEGGYAPAYKKYGLLLRFQAKLFDNPKLKERANEYLKKVKGEEENVNPAPRKKAPKSIVPIGKGGKGL